MEKVDGGAVYITIRASIVFSIYISTYSTQIIFYLNMYFSITLIGNYRCHYFSKSKYRWTQFSWARCASTFARTSARLPVLGQYGPECITSIMHIYTYLDS